MLQEYEKNYIEENDPNSTIKCSYGWLQRFQKKIFNIPQNIISVDSDLSENLPIDIVNIMHDFITGNDTSDSIDEYNTEPDTELIHIPYFNDTEDFDLAIEKVESLIQSSNKLDMDCKLKCLIDNKKLLLEKKQNYIQKL
ncbi:hypothetical protein A3Q56_04889 [Intoshia linei]|uniref:Uncharacterized protein n=1 Tax=Intoshia linei TaxID=1819745 RepID=A0A177AZT0_9BILA|nr:hypothetical protein A3Q56_04889 [Intoshia linei]